MHGWAELARCDGIDDDPPSSNQSLLRAIMANLYHGLRLGSLSQENVSVFAANVLDRVAGYLERNQLDDVAKLPVDHLYVLVCQALESCSQQQMMCRSTKLNGCASLKGISVRMHSDLRHWVDGIEENDLLEPEAARVHKWCNQAFDVLKRKKDAQIGGRGRVVWLTPDSLEAKHLFDAAGETFIDGGLDSVCRTGIADRFCDLLGLVHYIAPVHAIAIRTTSTLEALKAKSLIAAPTVFTAKDHKRFRHWPVQQGNDDVGRTYDLNADNRKAAADQQHGVPEVVALPFPLSEVQEIRYVGFIGAQDRGDSHLEYANEIAGDAGLAELIRAIDIHMDQ